MKHLLIIGAGGFGREIYNFLPFSRGYGTEFVVKGYLDDTENPLGGYKGYPPVIAPIVGYIPQPDDVFTCAIGDVAGKKKCILPLLEKGAEFINLISKRTSIDSNTTIGKGCIIQNSSLSCDGIVGDFVTIQDQVICGHDFRIGAWSHIHTRAFIGGWCQLGEGVHIGSYALIHPRKKVGDYATVGMGACVIRNVKPGTTVYGNPAKQL